MIFKNFADRTGSDSVLSDQDWTRTEKFHSPLICGIQHNNVRSEVVQKASSTVSDFLFDICYLQ